MSLVKIIYCDEQNISTLARWWTWCCKRRDELARESFEPGDYVEIRDAIAIEFARLYGPPKRGPLAGERAYALNPIAAADRVLAENLTVLRSGGRIEYRLKRDEQAQPSAREARTGGTK